jgi:hypothetical protein
MAPDVADEVTLPWEKEDVPDDDLLYRRVHHEKLYRDGRPRPAAFTDYKGGMSTDWQKYSNPEQTRSRATNRPQNEFAVVEFTAGQARHLNQLVEHDPLSDNRSHTNVVGEKDEEVRRLLSRLCRISLPLDPTVQLPILSRSPRLPLRWEGPMVRADRQRHLEQHRFA